ncbi:uncharacterized protein LOC108604667 [Drosophila busckii]|uniref:uncharacterized protein LOC108604667 n=1 Tax=Drosophila busckii TaxID=30019 RepID=UPI00083F3DC8|nr:uncharacterized protein LOC108604667 [Drosophila busckii]
MHSWSSLVLVVSLAIGAWSWTHCPRVCPIVQIREDYDKWWPHLVQLGPDLWHDYGWWYRSYLYHAVDDGYCVVFQTFCEVELTNCLRSSRGENTPLNLIHEWDCKIKGKFRSNFQTYNFE